MSVYPRGGVIPRFLEAHMQPTLTFCEITSTIGRRKIFEETPWSGRHSSNRGMQTIIIRLHSYMQHQNFPGYRKDVDIHCISGLHMRNLRLHT